MQCDSHSEGVLASLNARGPGFLIALLDWDQHSNNAPSPLTKQTAVDMLGLVGYGSPPRVGLLGHRKEKNMCTNGHN